MSNQVKKLVKGDFKVSSLIKLVTFLIGLPEMWLANWAPKFLF